MTPAVPPGSLARGLARLTGPRRRVTAGFLALPLAVLALAACGDDDDGDTSSTAAGAATPATASDETAAPDDSGAVTVDDSGAPADEEAFVTESADALELGDEEMSRCVAQAVIDTIGMDRITESGVTPEEFTNAGTLDEVGLAIDEADADDLTSTLAGCGDLVEGLVSSAPTQEQADCVRAEIDNDLAAELVVSQLAGLEPSPELAAARDAAQACAQDAAPTTT